MLIESKIVSRKALAAGFALVFMTITGGYRPAAHYESLRATQGELQKFWQKISIQA